MSENKVVLTKTIPGGHGLSVEILKGQTLVITDLEGEQIAALVAFSKNDFRKYMSVSHTRSTYDKYYLEIGDNFYTAEHEPMIRIVEDSCGVHDMTFPSCNQYAYDKMGIADHRSCQSNFAESLAMYGIEEWMLPDPVHFFQNSPNMQMLPNHSKQGDSVELRFLMDAIVAVSACPFDLNGINGGKPTSIQLTIEENE
jgi:uncharacterized protein YcgI (DUF1989 family)